MYLLVSFISLDFGPSLGWFDVVVVVVVFIAFRVWARVRSHRKRFVIFFCVLFHTPIFASVFIFISILFILVGFCSVHSSYAHTCNVFTCVSQIIYTNNAVLFFPLISKCAPFCSIWFDVSPACSNVHQNDKPQRTLLYKQYGNKIRACSCSCAHRSRAKKKLPLASFDCMGIVMYIYSRWLLFFCCCCSFGVWTFLGSSFQSILINSIGFSLFYRIIFVIVFFLYFVIVVVCSFLLARLFFSPNSSSASSSLFQLHIIKRQKSITFAMILRMSHRLKQLKHLHAELSFVRWEVTTDVYITIRGLWAIKSSNITVIHTGGERTSDRE